MTDDQLVDELAAVVWGLNLDRDAVSIARDLVPVVRQVAPLVAPPGGAPLPLLGAGTPVPLSPAWWAWLREAWNTDREVAA